MIVDDSLISEINSLREQASYQLAEQKCREAKSAGGTPAGFGVLHGQILENLNRHEEAIWALREETTAHPEGADAFFHLGRVLIETDRAEIETGEVRGPYMLSFEWGQISCPHHPSFPPSLIAESMACLERCIELDPSRNDARILLALIQFDIPDARAECVPVIQQIVSTSPELHDGHFAMARLALWQGAVEVAHAAFSHVLANAPAYPHIQAYHALATFGARPSGTVPNEILSQSLEGHCLIAGALGDTLANSNISTPLRANYENLARAYAIYLAHAAIESITERGAIIETTRLLDAVLKISGSTCEACLAFGHLMFAGNSMDMAAAGFENALAHDPDNAEAKRMINLINVRSFGGPQYGGLTGPWPAPSYSGLLLEMSAEDVLKIGETNCQAIEFEKATRVFSHGAALYPDNVEIQLRYSEVLAYQGLIDQAVEPAEKAYELAPEDGFSAANLGGLYRCSGKIGESWKLMERRFFYERPGSRKVLPNMPRWTGEPLEGGKLLIWREEGIGDEIRYASCISDAIGEVGVENIVWECSPRLHSLFVRSFPGLDVRVESLDRPDHDGAVCHLPMMSMAGRYRNDLSAFPSTGHYLVPDESRVLESRQRFSDLSAKPKIGICWRSLNMSWRKRPQSNSLTDWAAVLGGGKYTFVNLQAGDCEEEIAGAREQFGCTIHTFEDLDIKNDAEETAAMISALDAVVSCRCWIITFAGALGKPVFNYSGPYNNTVMDLPYDPWAPTTKTYYRRHSDDWNDCMTALSHALDEYIDGSVNA